MAYYVTFFVVLRYVVKCKFCRESIVERDGKFYVFINIFMLVAKGNDAHFFIKFDLVKQRSVYAFVLNDDVHDLMILEVNAPAVPKPGHNIDYTTELKN